MSTTLAAPTIVDRYAKKFAGSRRRAEEARGLFPQGVTHDLRHLEPFPVYIDRAIDELRKHRAIDDALLPHVSPLGLGAHHPDRRLRLGRRQAAQAGRVQGVEARAGPASANRSGRATGQPGSIARGR